MPHTEEQITRMQTGQGNGHWLEWEHPEYTALKGKWQYIEDHYRADVLSPDNYKKYLLRRSQGETNEAFQERRSIADYTPHMATVVDSLAGMLYNVDDDAVREFGSLGSPKDMTSVMGRLWKDADLAGNGWQTVFKILTTSLIHTQRWWVFVEGGATGDARVRLVSPMAVTNWRTDNGRIVEAVVVETMDRRASLKADPGLTKTYLHFQLGRWTRYELVKDKATGMVTAVSLGDGTYVHKDPIGQDVLPIFLVELPLRRLVGYILARKANAILNMESARDNLLRIACFPRLNLVAADDLFDSIAEKIKAGSNVLQNDPNYTNMHNFIAPSSEPARVQTEVLKRKVEEFWRMGFKEYAEAATEKTATEVRQDVASGAGSFLQLLKTAIDDAETQALWRVAQVEAKPQNTWFDAFVERGTDFIPPDLDASLDAKRKRYFGETTPVPVGREGLIDVVTDIMIRDEMEVDKDQVAAAVDAFLANKLLSDTTLPIPGLVKALSVKRIIMAMGIIDPKEKVQLDSGEEVLLIDEITDASEQLAAAKEEGERNASLMFGG